MASQAQILANQANAIHSTGPRTDAGKAASSRNATTHGFSTGVFQIEDQDQPYFQQFEATLHDEVCPAGAMELDALREVRDAFFRLRQIRKIITQLGAQYGDDALVHPETAAAMRQLTRYRAAAEMQLYRAIDALSDLQLIRAGRMAHLTANEAAFVGPMVPSEVFAFQQVGLHQFGRAQRECYERNLETEDPDQAARLARFCLVSEPQSEGNSESVSAS